MQENKGEDDKGNCVNAVSSNDLFVVYDMEMIDLAYHVTSWVANNNALFHAILEWNSLHPIFHVALKS